MIIVHNQCVCKVMKIKNKMMEKNTNRVFARFCSFCERKFWSTFSIIQIFVFNSLMHNFWSLISKKNVREKKQLNCRQKKTQMIEKWNGLSFFSRCLLLSVSPFYCAFVNWFKFGLILNDLLRIDAKHIREEKKSYDWIVNIVTMANV